MKKLMFATAVAAAGLAYGVESANVVGYTTLNAGAGKWTMVGVQFEDVGTTSKNLLEYVKTTAKPVTKANQTSGATLMLMRNGVYSTYYYQSDAFNSTLFDENFDWDAFEALAEEDEDAADEMFEAEASKAMYYSEGWAIPGGNLVTSVPVDVGDAAWYYNPSEAATLTMAGEVNGTLSFPIPCGAGMNMVASPYPGDVAFSKLSFGKLVAAESAADATTIMVMGASGTYSTYYYLADAFNTALFDENFDWDAYDELAEEDEDAADAMFEAEASKAMYHSAGWAIPGGNLATGTFAPTGYGFWLKLPTADTATVTK